ncbi:hypothetical protein [Colwellia piezophila]|uniref:hypothetical protein n=1 Tax=Colwellia piezophila TaxID=211668 RepID=UPI0003623E6F|nr:hypothetical protein [Colwellia piezophila]
MTVFEVLLIILLPTVTLTLNYWRQRVSGQSRFNNILYELLSFGMSGGPLVYLIIISPENTALEVVLVGICFFWFAIVGGRNKTHNKKIKWDC